MHVYKNKIKSPFSQKKSYSEIYVITLGYIKYVLSFVTKKKKNLIQYFIKLSHKIIILRLIFFFFYTNICMTFKIVVYIKKIVYNYKQRADYITSNEILETS